MAKPFAYSIQPCVNFAIFNRAGRASPNPPILGGEPVSPTISGEIKRGYIHCQIIVFCHLDRSGGIFCQTTSKISHFVRKIAYGWHQFFRLVNMCNILFIRSRPDAMQKTVTSTEVERSVSNNDIDLSTPLRSARDDNNLCQLLPY